MHHGQPGKCLVNEEERIFPMFSKKQHDDNVLGYLLDIYSSCMSDVLATFP